MGQWETEKRQSESLGGTEEQSVLKRRTVSDDSRRPRKVRSEQCQLNLANKRSLVTLVRVLCMPL